MRAGFDNLYKFWQILVIAGDSSQHILTKYYGREKRTGMSNIGIIRHTHIYLEIMEVSIYER